jgi:DNA-directed RNA polymerase subunit RPC12/RpoP
MSAIRFYEAGICRECGDIITTQYERDEALCFECSTRLDEEEEDDSEECPLCGGSLNPRNPESCFCSRYDEDE